MNQKSKKKSGYSTYHNQIKHLIQIGVALSGEKNINRLLEKIVDEARKLTNADAGFNSQLYKIIHWIFEWVALMEL